MFYVSGKQVYYIYEKIYCNRVARIENFFINQGAKLKLPEFIQKAWDGIKYYSKISRSEIDLLAVVLSTDIYYTHVVVDSRQDVTEIIKNNPRPSKSSHKSEAIWIGVFYENEQKAIHALYERNAGEIKFIGEPFTMGGKMHAAAHFSSLYPKK